MKFLSLSEQYQAAGTLLPKDTKRNSRNDCLKPVNVATPSQHLQVHLGARTYMFATVQTRRSGTASVALATRIDLASAVCKGMCCFRKAAEAGGIDFLVLLHQNQAQSHCVRTAASAGRPPQLTAINFGTGWVLVEQPSDQATCTLLSILSPRRPARSVAAYLEQLYVDRFCSIRAQLVYKKSRKHAAWPIKIDRYGLGMHCGHDPHFFGIYAQKILLTGNILEYEYKIVEAAEDPRHILFQIKRQFLTVNG